MHLRGQDMPHPPDPLQNQVYLAWDHIYLVFFVKYILLLPV